MSKVVSLSLSKPRVIGFLWQHVLLLVSLYVMTLGVALCVRPNMGSSVISSLPMSMSLAGADGMVPALTIGSYTNMMNMLLVVLVCHGVCGRAGEILRPAYGVV